MSQKRGMETEALAKLVLIVVVLAVILLFVIRGSREMTGKYNSTSSQITGEVSGIASSVGDLRDMFGEAFSGLPHYTEKDVPVTAGNCNITQVGSADCGLIIKYGTNAELWQSPAEGITCGTRVDEILKASVHWCKGSVVHEHCKVNLHYCRQDTSPTSEYDFTVEELPCEFKITDSTSTNCKSNITVGDCTDTANSISEGGSYTSNICNCKLTRANPSSCTPGNLTIEPVVP